VTAHGFVIVLFGLMLLTTLSALLKSYKRKNIDAAYGWIVAAVAEIGWFMEWVKQ